MISYEIKKIKDICTFVGGSQPPKKEFIHEPKEGYIRLVQIRDRLNDNFITFVPKNSVTKFCKKDDILIGRYGPPIFQIFRGFEGAYNVAIMKAIPLNDVNNDYLYYFLLRKDILEYVESMSTRTAGQTGVELDSLYEYPVKLPPKEYQIRFASILKSIDDKIQINNRINAELKSMAKTIYDYWFTQFDFPDVNGKPYRSSGGKMVWSEQLRKEIPKDWKVKKLSDVFDITMGSSPIGDSLNENKHGIEFYQGSTDFGQLYPTERIYTTAPIRFAKAQDILLSVRAPVGDINIAMNDCCIGRGLAAIHHDSTIYAWCTLNAFQPYFDIFNGNGTTFGSLTKDTLEGKLMLSPDIDTLQRFIQVSKPLEKKLRFVSMETRQLCSLRDWLLPILMNGQVGFKEKQEEKPQIKVSDFQQWLANQGFAARGDMDMDVLRDIYEAMDDDDK